MSHIRYLALNAKTRATDQKVKKAKTSPGT